MKIRYRTIITFLFVGVIFISAACYRVYQNEIVAGNRRVDAFWGRIGEEFTPIEVVPAFPPIIDAEVVRADEADIAHDELVLAVAINGDARAYALNMLTGPQREIINDELGGRSIAATW